MRNEDFDEFAQLLDDAYDLIGVGANKIISGGAKSMFFAAMAPYSLETVRAALSAHCLHRERGRFTPKPADLIEQIEGAAARDNRPGAEEAWAIALTSEDESETIVWTSEIAEAFNICRPVLETSGAISARKTFIEAYERIVTGARQQGVAAQWLPSLGWDVNKREAALSRAQTAGLLPAPVVANLLPPPAKVDPSDEKAKAGLAMVKAAIAQIEMGWERDAKAHEAYKQAERAEVARKKQELADRVASYQQGAEVVSVPASYVSNQSDVRH